MSSDSRTLTIGIPIYTGVDPLDVVGPYEVFSTMAQEVKGRSDVRVLVLAESNAPVNTRLGLTLFPHRAFHEVEALDVLWVPGGDVSALQVLMQGGLYLDCLNRWATGARWVTSVCEGAMLLAAAGLLDGYSATTHWAFLPCFARFPGVTPVGGDGYWPRFVVDRNRVTGGGISSGLDEALQLVVMLFDPGVAESVQRTIQYYPEPPVHGTIPEPTGCPIPPA